MLLRLIIFLVYMHLNCVLLVELIFLRVLRSPFKALRREETPLKLLLKEV